MVKVSDFTKPQTVKNGGRRTGTLADIFYKRQSQYKPKEELATPDYNLVRGEAKAEMKRINRKAKRACFFNEKQ